MVAASDLQKAMRLQSELQNIESAVGGLNEAWRINGMIVGPPQQQDSPLQPTGMTISTAGMAYPQTMIDTIKSLLQTRKGAIEQELRDIGVTS